MLGFQRPDAVFRFVSLPAARFSALLQDICHIPGHQRLEPRAPHVHLLPRARRPPLRLQPIRYHLIHIRRREMRHQPHLMALVLDDRHLPAVLLPRRGEGAAREGVADGDGEGDFRLVDGGVGEENAAAGETAHRRGEALVGGGVARGVGAVGGYLVVAAEELGKRDEDLVKPNAAIVDAIQPFFLATIRQGHPRPLRSIILPNPNQKRVNPFLLPAHRQLRKHRGPPRGLERAADPVLLRLVAGRVHHEARLPRRGRRRGDEGRGGEDAARVGAVAELGEREAADEFAGLEHRQEVAFLLVVAEEANGGAEKAKIDREQNAEGMVEHATRFNDRIISTNRVRPLAGNRVPKDVVLLEDVPAGPREAALVLLREPVPQLELRARLKDVEELLAQRRVVVHDETVERRALRGVELGEGGFGGHGGGGGLGG
mmetsp:Transcript_4711/g.11477  ORF Transcript_4711/g.11477 Transcript_4711/m.11477 type:complete len:430 (-) Transcript_4711:116-1405(-)